MKILFVTPHSSLGYGGAVHTENLIKIISDGGGELTVMAGCKMGPDCRLFKTYRGTFGKIIGWFCLKTELLIKGVLEEIKSTDYDVVWLDSSLYGEVALELRNMASKAKIIFTFHNIETDYLKSVPLRLMPHKYVKYLAVRRAERFAIKYADLGVFITRSDQNYAINKGLPTSQTLVVPVMYDKLRCGTSRSISCSRRLVFCGSDFPPNIEAAKFICDTIAPSLPEFEFNIYGSVCCSLNRCSNFNNIQLKGFTEDLDKVYQPGDIALMPIFSGAGMKVKILDPLIRRIPVVGTSLSFAGYEDLFGTGFIHIAAPIQMSNLVRSVADRYATLEMDQSKLDRFSMSHNSKTVIEVIFGLLC
jgi:hypothetical protein